MLNELLVVERGVRRSGIPIFERHPDLKDAGKFPTLLVQLDTQGLVVSARPLPQQVTPWTIRDGQHNSFPVVKPGLPLWSFESGDQTREELRRKRGDSQRTALLEAMRSGGLNADSHATWPSSGFLGRLRERRKQLVSLDGSAAEIVPQTFDRFAAAVGRTPGAETMLLEAVADQVLAGLERSAQADWLDVAMALLVGGFDKKAKKWVCSGALLFEAAGAAVPIYDHSVLNQTSDALRAGISEAQGDASLEGTCALTGERVPLVSGNFQQPNLEVLGQTFLFAKNEDIPANDRYGRFAAKAMPVGRDVIDRLAGALKAITTPERKGVTWLGIPGERPKQTDLLIAYVEGALDVPAAASLGEELEDAASESGADRSSESIARFEKRTQRLMEAVRAKVGADFRHTPVHVILLRKVDPANRKVVYAGAPTVASLYDAAISWAAGERNVPPWLALRVFRAGHTAPHLAPPPHVYPLQLVELSKQIFLRSGERPNGKRTEVVGLPAAEVLELFLARPAHPVQPAVIRVLRMLLTRRSSLVWRVAHSSRRPSRLAAPLDRWEALRSVTVLAVLLFKLGRTKELYMNETAFKLGQLLAVADIVHAGYCADLRGGQVPPSLLGNQVFPMALAAPEKALATLSRRWKPYAGWVAKAACDRSRATGLVASRNERERERGWAIRKAVRHARDIAPLAREIGSGLARCKADERFRAELLLGYLAGLPKRERDDEDQVEDTSDAPGRED